MVKDWTRMKEFLICLSCKNSRLDLNERKIVCGNCGQSYKVDEYGIIYFSNPETIYQQYYNNVEITEIEKKQQKRETVNLKFEEFQALLPKKNQFTSYLDIGCGCGILLRLFSNYFSSSYNFGLDLSQSQLVEAGIENPTAVLIKGNAENLPFKDSIFDVVTIADVVEHVENPVLLLKEAFRVSKKILIIRVPLEKNFERLSSIVFKKPIILVANLIKTRILKKEKKNTFDLHIQHFTKSSFFKMLDEIKNLRVIQYSLPDNPFAKNYKVYDFPPPLMGEISIIIKTCIIIDYYLTLYFRKFVYFILGKKFYNLFCNTTLNIYCERSKE